MRHTAGWFKAWRDAWGKDLSQNMALWAIWNALLHMASWRESQIIWEGKQRVLPPGSVVFGISEIAEQWECSKSTVSKWLHYLKDTGRISLESCSRGTIATICNWELYQAIEFPERTPGERGPNAERTPREPYEEGKKRRKKEEYDESFEKLYQGYPRKEGKTPGHRVYLRLTEEERKALPGAIENYRRAKSSTDPKYLMHFGTFMNQWRDWLDAQAGAVVSIQASRQAEIDADLAREKAEHAKRQAEFEAEWRAEFGGGK